MQTIKDVFMGYRHELKKLYDKTEREAITLLAISQICKLSKAKIKAFPELELPPEKTEKLKQILIELKAGKPLQYILGETEFYGLPFFVNPSVLIPRQETEELADWIIKSLSSEELAENSRQRTENDQQPAAGCILDIGTGSGCIAISLKKNLPALRVMGLDISNKALQVAKENAKLNDVEIELVEADILNSETIAGSKFSHVTNLLYQFSLIVSNPPYVTQHDKTQMHINVTNFEPHIALFVPEDDPLKFYKAIADFSVKNLAKNGLLFFEINESYGNEIIILLTNTGFKNIELREDMNGKERMIKATL